MAPTVHTYRSSETGLFVNSYLVEGEDGVVAVDAPLLLSDGHALRARLEALKKPLLAVLLTHPHPDHYNTVTQLVAGDDVPVVAHTEVDREIREHDEAKRAQWGPVFGDEWPSSATFPNRTVDDGESLDLAGLRFTAWQVGPCESEAETVWLLGDGETAFVGDLAFNGTHAYLADGLTGQWLAALDRAEEALAGAATLYVGHGAPASPAVLGEQRRYRLMAREAVSRIAPGRSELSEHEATQVAGLMERFLPGAPLSWLVSVGAPAVAAELAREANPGLRAKGETMIGRLWHGKTTSGNADAYQALLEAEVLPGIRIEGYRGAYVLRREGDDGVEFATLTLWDSLDAVREFAGDDHERAVVLPEARRLLAQFDERSKHYEIVLEP